MITFFSIEVLAQHSTVRYLSQIFVNANFCPLGDSNPCASTWRASNFLGVDMKRHNNNTYIHYEYYLHKLQSLGSGGLKLQIWTLFGMTFYLFVWNPTISIISCLFNKSLFAQENRFPKYVLLSLSHSNKPAVTNQSARLDQPDTVLPTLSHVLIESAQKSSSKLQADPSFPVSLCSRIVYFHCSRRRPCLVYESAFEACELLELVDFEW